MGAGKFCDITKKSSIDIELALIMFPIPFVHFHALQRGKLGWLGGERKMGGEGQLLLRERKTTIAS